VNTDPDNAAIAARLEGEIEPERLLQRLPGIGAKLTHRRHDELGKANDWVVIYCHSDRRENQRTVVTAAKGPLAGRGFARGREDECRALFEQRSAGRA
jgi:hypothetical protein